MENIVNLTQEEVKAYKDIAKQIQIMTYNIGQVQVSIRQLNDIKAQIVQKYLIQSKKLKQFTDGLKSKYGDGVIDIVNSRYIKQEKKYGNV